MEELTKKIKRDLFDIKENINNPDKLMELFSFKKDEFEKIIHNLKYSVEDSLFEYKKTTINLILDPLISLQYDSRAMNSFDDQIISAKGLLSVVLIQRLIAVGTIKTTDNKREISRETLEQEVSKPGIREILEFVQKEPKTNPDILKDTLFKKIVMHIKMYRNESQKMKDLMEKVPVDKKSTIKRNFEIILAEKILKMREAYNEIIDRTVKKEQAPVVQNLLLRYDFKTMGKFYMNQIEAYSKLLSTLTFAKSEKFQTRELLLNLAREKASFSTLIEKERSEYGAIVLSDEDGTKTGKAFLRRIIEFLKKEKDWLRIHPGK